MKNEQRRASLLIEAVKAEDMEAIVKLIRRRSKLIGSRRKSLGNLQDTDGLSSLHQASLMGNMQILKMLLEIGVNLDQTDAKGMTPLHYASWHNTPDTASILLQKGAKVDVCNNEGNTPLHIACQHGQIDVITLLIYYRADPTIRNKHGLTPFDVACEYGRLKTVEILLDSGHCKRLLFVHDDGTKDHVMVSPLHLAAKNGHNDVIRLLLESGCDINHKVRYGTALHDASAANRAETVKLLLHAGADVHATNNNGQTPLDLVKKVSSKHDPTAQVVKQLLQEAQKAIYTKAICDHCAQNEDELSFNYGDVIWVTNQCNDTKWKGVIFGPKYTSRIGFFPASSVQLIDKKAGMMRLANQRQVKKVGVPKVPDVKCEPSSSLPLNSPNETSSSSTVANSNRTSESRVQSPNQLHSAGDTMKSSRSTFLSNKPPHSSATMPNSISAYNIANYHQQRINETNKLPCDSSNYYGTRTENPLNSPSQQHRMSNSSTTSSQTSSGFESMKNGSYSLSNAAVHQMRNFNSPSRSSMHSNGSSSLGSLEKLDEFGSTNNGRINVAEMLLNGVPEEEILSIWLHSLRYEEYLTLFLNAGYDLATVVRMTPEDLTAIGITKPGHRKRLTAEIRKLNVTDSWPVRKPATVREWLSALFLPQYIPWFVAQGLSNTDQIMQLTFEDFEDIGVKKLGHLKKLICALKKLKDSQTSTNNCRSSTPINYVSSNGISEVLLINVPTTPKHVGEIRPYYHSPQNQHNHQTSSSTSNSMRTFQNKYQDQHVWRTDAYDDVNGLACPSSNNINRSHLNSPSKRSMQINKNHLHQDDFIYDNANSHHQPANQANSYHHPANQSNDSAVGAGCNTFAFWRECAGEPPAKPPPVRTKLQESGSNKDTSRTVRYTTADAIMHQPDRPKVIVKPCPAPKPTSTTNLNGNPFYDCDEKMELVNRYCRTDGNFAFAHQEQLGHTYAYYDPRSSSMKLTTCLQEDQSDYQTPIANYGTDMINSVYSNAEYAMHLQEPLLDYVDYPINHNYQQLILDQRLLQPSMTNSCMSSSSIFQLSPQPYLDEFVELSPTTSVDEFPPPLRPISCEEQIRNLHYLQQPPTSSEQSNVVQNEMDHSMKIAKQNHQAPFHEKRVTFASFPSPSRHKNTMQALNACSLDNYNGYIDSLPFANENVGTIKGKMTNSNGQHCSNRKSINEIFNADSSCTGNQPPGVLEDIGDMLQDLTDQLDALLTQRSAARHNNCQN